MRQMWGVSVHEQVLSHTVDDLGNADADSGSYSGACDGDCYVNMNITSTQIYIYIYVNVVDDYFDGSRMTKPMVKG